MLVVLSNSRARLTDRLLPLRLRIAWTIVSAPSTPTNGVMQRGGKPHEIDTAFVEETRSSVVSASSDVSSPTDSTRSSGSKGDDQCHTDSASVCSDVGGAADESVGFASPDVSISAHSGYETATPEDMDSLEEEDSVDTPSSVYVEVVTEEDGNDEDEHAAATVKRDARAAEAAASSRTAAAAATTTATTTETAISEEHEQEEKAVRPPPLDDLLEEMVHQRCAMFAEFDALEQERDDDKKERRAKKEEYAQLKSQWKDCKRHAKERKRKRKLLSPSCYSNKRDRKKVRQLCKDTALRAQLVESQFDGFKKGVELEMQKMRTKYQEKYQQLLAEAPLLLNLDETFPDPFPPAS